MAGPGGMALALPLLAAALAGCLSSPEPVAQAGLPGPPAVEAPGATLEALGDAVRVTWQGTVDPARAPVVDPRWPVPRAVQLLAAHGLALPPSVSLVEGWLNWSGAEGYLGFQLVNASGALWCGANPGGAQSRACLATLHARRAAPEAWSADVLGDAYDLPPGPVPYTLSLVFRAAELPRLGPPLPHGQDAPLRFEEPVVVFDEARAHEPSIAVTPGGTVYIAAWGNPYGVWRSLDGRSFENVRVSEVPYCALGDFSRVPPMGLLDTLLPGERPPELTHFGCGDTDVATAGEETVFLSAHWGNEAVSASHDGGRSWSTSVLAAGADVHTDRQWLVTDGPAWHAFTSVMTNRLTVAKTVDGGRTWLNLGWIPFERRCVSTLARDAEGTLYIGSCDAQGPGVGVSTDGGLTWQWRGAAQRDALGFLIVQATTDAAGNLYLVWTEPPGEGRGTTVWYAGSRDRGASWGPPRPVFSAPGTYVFPWGTGGAEGHLAVAAYATRWQGDPSVAVGDWYPVVALTQDALGEEPAWLEASASDEPLQYGPICLGGNSCAHGRNLGDFFQVQADGEGMVHVAYAAADEADGLRPGIVYVRQGGGPTLGGPSVDKHGGR